MSSKTQTTATKEEAKPALVPKLRFPEFRGAEGWQEVALGEIADIKLGKMLDKQKHTTGRLLPYLNNISVRWNQVDTANLPQMYFDDDELDRFGLKAGDVVVCEGGEPGRAAVWDGRLPDLKFQKAIHRVRFKIPFQPRLLVLHLENLAGTTRFESQFTGGGIKHLTAETFARLKIPLVPKAEQQKIAECLSSVDELMAAQARKVDALKTHKKGLMQQLFPREGETQPRLRFPEFQNAGEWEETKLGKHVEIQSGYSPSAYALSSNGEYAFVKVEDLNNCIKYQVSGREFCDDSDGVVPTDSILFPKRGAAIELNKIRITATEILIDTNLMALTPKDGLKAEFLYYYLSNVGLSHIADTSTIPQINNKHIIPFDVRLPEEDEQQRIATCLSSLDALISAETRKLEALKTHKKGLMQQLFPSPEEVEA